MADSLPKFDLSPVLAFPFALASVGYRLVAEALTKHGVVDKVTSAKDHKVVQTVSGRKELVLALLGLALVFHGAQFKNLLLCSQVVLMFLYERVTGSASAALGDIQTAQEKLKADAPADTSNKKKANNGKEAAILAKRKEDAEAAKKALKVLDAEKLKASALEMLGAFAVCVLIIHGGLAQKVAIAISLVNLLIGKVEAVVEFPDHQDLGAWTGLFLRMALYAVILPMTFLSSSLALAMTAAACGAQLAVEHGARFMANIGKVPDADAFLASKKGFLAACGLLAVGTLWQLWALLAGSGLGYFGILYLPAVAAEALVGLLAGGSA